MSVSASDWLKGITLSIAASIVGGASKLSIRKSWLMEEELDTESTSSNGGNYERFDDGQPQSNQTTDLTRESTTLSPTGTRRLALCLRLFGMLGMTFLNPLCSVLAMNYASPSILAPFSGLTLVWIVLLSNPLIGERPSTPQIIAASLIVLGEVIVAIFGDHTNSEGVTLEDLELSYQDPYFIAYLIGITVWILLLAYLLMYSKSPFLKRFAWGASGGSITGLQNFLKDSLTAFKSSSGSRLPWYLPIWILMALVTAFGGLLFLTSCMKRYDATYSSAMFVGSFVFSASIMSVVHYKTFENLQSIWNYILYPAGLAVLTVGVGILVQEADQSSSNGMSNSRNNSIHEILIQNEHIAVDLQSTQDQEETAGETQ